MSEDFRIAAMQDSSVLMIYSKREHIHTRPPYQRMGDVWNLEKRQLLIDSLLNGFDIPKLYFHEFMPVKKIGNQTFRYAIVDGKQRLETIWKFIEGDFPLASDFKYFADPKVNAANMTYADLSNKYPSLKISFDSRTLPIITIQTEDTDLIEEMFSRLNEAVPLNAAEKRNAWGGACRKSSANSRSMRFLFAHSRLKTNGTSTSTSPRSFSCSSTMTRLRTQRKKDSLDALVLEFAHKRLADADMLKKRCEPVLDAMVGLFTKEDSLLKSIGMITVYYALSGRPFRRTGSGKWTGPCFKSLRTAVLQIVCSLKTTLRKRIITLSF